LSVFSFFLQFQIVSANSLLSCAQILSFYINFSMEEFLGFHILLYMYRDLGTVYKSYSLGSQIILFLTCFFNLESFSSWSVIISILLYFLQ
jgi:hypothetical protein